MFGNEDLLVRSGGWGLGGDIGGVLGTCLMPRMPTMPLMQLTQEIKDLRLNVQAEHDDAESPDDAKSARYATDVDCVRDVGDANDVRVVGDVGNCWFSAKFRPAHTKRKGNHDSPGLAAVLNRVSEYHERRWHKCQ